MYFPKSFNGLFNFGYQRRGLEVPVFFIVYLIGSVMAGAIIGAAVSSLVGSDTIRIQWRIDYITASLLFFILTYLIIQQKALAKDLKILWILPVVAALLTFFTGHVMGLLIPLILSTRPNKHAPSATPNETTSPQKPEPQK